MSGLKENEINKIREELSTCKRPIFIFDDDADGLCSFLLLYKHIKEGKGVVVKAHPTVDAKFVRKVEEYEADKVFILDIAILKQEFVDNLNVPVIWIDHHGPNEVDNALVFNPRKHKKDIVYPTSNICFDVVKENIWIAMIGCIGDWHIPDFIEDFCLKYPDLIDKNIDHPGKAMFETKIGELVKIFNFILKGTIKDAMQCIKVLTRIESPYEILNQETKQGKFIYQKYDKINKAYEDLKKDIKVDNDNFLIYTYPESKMSFTGEIANELLYKHPEKIIIVAREKSGEMRMSLRTRDVILPPILDKALLGLEGYGGGHEHACGACVKKEDFKEFVNRLRKEI